MINECAISARFAESVMAFKISFKNKYLRNNDMRPLCSLLIMLANRSDMLAKSPSYGADAPVIDLEDSVPIAEFSLCYIWAARGDEA
jgi:hypothetical protein